MARIYPFTVGDGRLTVVEEGGFELPFDSVAAQFPTVRPAEIAALLGGEVALTVSINPLLIEVGDQRVLVDVGFGVLRRPQLGNMLLGLADLGIAPRDISLVFLTHFHSDHFHGLFDGDGKLIYPHAHIAATQAEWDEWLPRWRASDDADDQRWGRRFATIEDHFTRLQDGDSVLEGVRVFLSPGHTLGHAALMIESGGESLVVLADLMARPFQFQHPEWPFANDSDPTLATESRRRWMGRCADEKLLTLLYHMPFPGLGYIVRDGEGFVWEPITPS